MDEKKKEQMKEIANELLEFVEGLKEKLVFLRINPDGSMEGDPKAMVQFLEESIRMKERLKKDGIDLDKMIPIVWGIKK